MPLTASFQISISADPSAINLVDTSTGTDVTVVGRKLNIYDISNTLFGASPYNWPNFPGTTTITINPLSKDKALNLVVTWVDVNGNVLYTASQIFAFRGYGIQFYAGLIRTQSSKPDIVNDNGYFSNLGELELELNNASFAINQMSDIVAAQGCIDRYMPLIQNSTDFF